MDEAITQMMTAYIRQFADTVPSAERSIQHGRVLDDAGCPEDRYPENGPDIASI